MTMLLSDQSDLVEVARQVCFRNLTKNLFNGDMSTAAPRGPDNFFGGHVYFEFPFAPTPVTCKTAPGNHIPSGTCHTQEITGCRMHAPVFTHSDPPGFNAGHPFSTLECDSAASKLLDDGILVANLTFLFEADPDLTLPSFSLKRRGIHAGHVCWVPATYDSTAKTLKAKPVPQWHIQGNMAGTNSTGLALQGVPPLGSATNFVGDNCNEAYLHGRLTGTVAAAGSPLDGAMISAVYRISYDPTPAKQKGSDDPYLVSTGQGVLAGVLMQKCKI